MDRAKRDRWTAALRSGEFEQGSGYLCYDNRYCSLGVYEELEGKLEFVNFESSVPIKKVQGTFHSLSMPSAEACTEIGDSNITILINMNDYHGNSFSEIADWIEANL